MIAAIAAGVLVAFGLAALIVPPLLAGDSKAASNDRGSAALPALNPTSGAPSAVPSSAPAAPTPTPTPQTHPTTGPTVALTGNARFEQQVVAMVNGERRRARCQPVRVDGKLQAAARSHSADMATNDFVSHKGTDGSSADDRIRQAGADQPLGENVAKGGDPQSVMRAWLHDRGDRANILNCDARFIGVGVVLNGRTPYWTQDFAGG
jgi:uncharacterized protein YkwD